MFILGRHHHSWAVVVPVKYGHDIHGENSVFTYEILQKLRGDLPKATHDLASMGR